MGNVLALDRIVNVTTFDEFIYHESIVHPAMHWFCEIAGFWPRTVVLIGGGDGGSLRELRRYPELKKIIMREIDPLVVAVSRRFLPSVSQGAFRDRRLQRPFIGDGIDLVESLPAGSVDVVIVDSSDPTPTGPARKLVGDDFHRHVDRILSPCGVYVCQTGSPMLQPREWSDVWSVVKLVGFKRMRLVLPSVPTYYGGLFSLLMASKQDAYGPSVLDGEIAPQLSYLTSERMRADGVLPKFLLCRVPH